MNTPLKIRYKFIQMVKIFISGVILCTVSFVLLTLGFVEEAKILILAQIVGAIGLLFFIPLLIILFFWHFLKSYHLLECPIILLRGQLL